MEDLLVKMYAIATMSTSLHEFSRDAYFSLTDFCSKIVAVVVDVIIVAVIIGTSIEILRRLFDLKRFEPILGFFFSAQIGGGSTWCTSDGTRYDERAA